MKLLVSLLNFRPGCIGGTETYLRRVLRGLADLLQERPGDRLVIACHRDNADCDPGLLDAPSVDPLVVPLTETEVTRRRILEAISPWRDRQVEAMLAGPKPDVLLFPQQSMYPKAAPGPAVLTVHDFQHLTLPRNIGLADRVYRRLIYPHAIRRAQRIIAISDHVAGELVRFHRVDRHRVDVVRHGFDTPDLNRSPDQPPALPDGLPERFFYYPAATHPHKNHRQLFETWARLADELRLPIVLTGQLTPHWVKLQRRLEALGATDHVHALGFVPYELVQTLYARADAVLFPTTHEGFGIPVLEAVAHGCRLITSPLPVFDEIGVPAENQIDFADVDQLATALRTALRPTRLTRPPLSWLQSARQTLAVLDRVAQEAPPRRTPR